MSALKKDEFRFCLLEGKIPKNFDWQNIKNYKYDDEILKNHINSGNNYGVVGGYGNLIIIDSDSEEVYKICEEKLPKTFTVKTGGIETYKKHYYFKCDDCKSWKIFDDNKDTLADIQGIGKQVVGPESIHPKTGNKYEIIDDTEIAFISSKELKSIFQKLINKYPESNKSLVENNKSENYEDDPLINKIKSKISFGQLLREEGYDLSKNPTMCKLGHTSDSQTCFSYDLSKGLWNCFHCESGGDIFNFIMDHKKLNFNQAKQYLMKKAGIELVDPVDIPKDINKNEYKIQILQYMASGKKHKATELIVKYIEEIETINTTRNDDRSEMWIYKEGIRVPSGKTYIREHVRDILGSLYKQHTCNEVISKIEADTFIEQDKFFEEESPDLVPLQNGILNIKTKQLIPFSSNYKFFNKLPLKYNPLKKCPNIIKFFEGVLHDKYDIKVIQELFGYTLYRKYFIEKAIMFTGGGRNGKSKTLTLFEKFVGFENISNISLEDMEKDQFSISELFKKMINICGDMNSTTLSETGNFLKLTGRDPIQASRKFLNRISFVNYAKLMMSTNEIPKTYTKTYAFFARWIIMDFPYTFVSEKEYQDAEDKTNLKIRDETIIDRISTEDEMSGLLNWALEGFDRISKTGDFSYSTSTEKVKELWIRKSDSVSAFIMDCIENDYEGILMKEDFRNLYVYYCRKYKLKIWNDKAIKNTLNTSFGAGETSRRVSFSNSQKTFWTGLSVKSEWLKEEGLEDPTNKYFEDNDLFNSDK